MLCRGVNIARMGMVVEILGKIIISQAGQEDCAWLIKSLLDKPG